MAGPTRASARRWCWIWGLNFVVMKWGLATLSPLLAVCAAVFMASLLLLLFSNTAQCAGVCCCRMAGAVGHGQFVSIVHQAESWVCTCGHGLGWCKRRRFHHAAGGAADGRAAPGVGSELRPQAWRPVAWSMISATKGDGAASMTLAELCFHPGRGGGYVERCLTCSARGGAARDRMSRCRSLCGRACSRCCR